MRKHWIQAAAVIAAAAFSSGAAAESAAWNSPTHATSDGIRAITGGIGETSEQAMRDVARDYSLGLTFANRRGAYLAEVDVTVKDRSGDVVFAGVSDGPMMLIDLPSGQYTVEATFADQTQRRQVSVDASRHRNLVMHWQTGSM